MRSISARPLITSSLVLALFVLTACGAAEAGEEPQTLSYSDLTSATSNAGKAVQRWISEVDEKSEGKLVVEPYFSSSLLTSTDALEGTGSGVSDITYTVVTYQPQALPVANWFNEQGSMPVDSYPHNQLQTVGVMNEVFSTEEVAKEFESQGVKFLTSTSVAGKYDLLCRKKIENQENLSGLRVRAPGPVWAVEAEALGMTVVNVAQSEAYEALQRGVIDCQIGAPFMYEDYGLSEVAKEYYPARFSANMGLVLLMNLEKWDSLSSEQQELLMESMQGMAVERTQGDIEAQQVFFDRREELGINTHDVAVLNKRLGEFQAKRSASWVDRAPDAIADPQKEADFLKATMGSWEETMSADVPLVKPGEVASPDINDYPAWEEKLTEIFAGRNAQK